MLLIRRVVFYFLLLIYVIACPLSILYAFGYILKPHSGKGVIKTGLIALETTPPGASIYIENKRFLQKTPAVIRDLVPGNYAVSLALKDYQSIWRTISIEPGMASVFTHTLLLPKRWNVQVLVPEAFENIIPLAGTHFFILARGLKLKDYLVYNWRRASARPLLDPDSRLNDARVLSYSLSKGSAYLFMHLALGSQERFIRIELKDRVSKVEDLSRFFYKLPLGVKWDPADPQDLFILEDNHLNRLELATESILPRYIEDVRGFAISERMLYLFGDGSKITRLDYDKKKIEVLHEGAMPEEVSTGQDEVLIIEPISREAIVFCQEQGELFLNLAPYRLLEKNVEGVEFDPETKRLAVWQKDKLGVVQMIRPMPFDASLQERFQLAWIFVAGKSISQCFWAHKGSHLVFLDGDKLYFLGVEGELNQSPAFLFEVGKDSSVYYHEPSGKIYYLDPVSGNFSSVTILPEKENFAFPFPSEAQ